MACRPRPCATYPLLKANRGHTVPSCPIQPANGNKVSMPVRLFDAKHLSAFSVWVYGLLYLMKSADGRSLSIANRPAVIRRTSDTAGKVFQPDGLQAEISRKGGAVYLWCAKGLLRRKLPAPVPPVLAPSA